MTVVRLTLFFGLLLALAVTGVEPLQATDPPSIHAAETGRSAAAGVRTSESNDLVSGWRRLDSGWVQTDDWTTSSSSTGQATATRIHPGLIASFVVLVSIGGLLGFEPAFRRRRAKTILSDSSLIQSWAFRLRNRVDSENCL